LIVFIDESGLSERPTRVRTWAPKGQTPVIQFHFNWTHVSVIAGLTRTHCMFRLHQGSIKKEQHVEFLKALRAHLNCPLLVIWDGLRAHRSKLVREYLDSTAGGIQMAFLPPYSPDLNPVEYLLSSGIEKRVILGVRGNRAPFVLTQAIDLLPLQALFSSVQTFATLGAMRRTLYRSL